MLRGGSGARVTGSTYLPNGQIIAGPAPRPLDYMAIRIDNGKVLVDTGEIQQRSKHDTEHVTPV